MPRFWTCHWQNRYWRGDINREYEPIDHSAGSIFTKRGVKRGDVVYVVSLKGGQLLLGGKMIVNRIVSDVQARRIFRTNIFEAEEHIIAKENSGTPLNLHRRLSPRLAKRLRFISPKSGEIPLFFVSQTHLDVQATRGVRELTAKSAELLDDIIRLTDGRPSANKMITVTDRILGTSTEVREGTAGHTRRVNQISRPSDSDDYAIDLDEPETSALRKSFKVQRIIRDSARVRILKQLHEHKCQICGERIQLSEGRFYSEGHHIQPLGNSHNGRDTPANILILCPNHHAMCDLGVIRLDLATLRRHKKHRVSKRYIDYHNQTIAKS